MPRERRASPPPSVNGSPGPGSIADPKGKGKAPAPSPSFDCRDVEQQHGVKRGHAPMWGDLEVTPIPLRTELTPQSGSGDSTDMPPRKWRRLRK